jgi:hypothetical protein
MQERVKFEAWIAGIEERRESTPANVYDRVHGDYVAKLAAVLEALKTHARELEQQAERFTARLAELATQEQQRLDTRAEAELRAHVGELSQEEWSVRAREADDALAAIAAEQAVVAADLNRVHELLGAAAERPAAAPAASEPAHATQAAAPAPAPEPAPHAADLGLPTVESQSEPSAGAAESATPEQQSFDELAFLKSVVSPAKAGAPVAPSASSAPTPPRSAAAVARAQTAGNHPTPRASQPVRATQAGRASQAKRQSGSAVRDEAGGADGLVGKAAEGDPPFAANVSGNHPVVLRPSGPVEQPKTLKCAECGAMNYATEWYCERCGAELASL